MAKDTDTSARRFTHCGIRAAADLRAPLALARSSRQVLTDALRALRPTASGEISAQVRGALRGVQLVFWAGEGLHFPWPGEDLAIIGLAVGVPTVSLLLISL